jgi:hypothetical protein
VGIARDRSARIWVAINVRRGRSRGRAPDRVTTERTANRTHLKARAAGLAPGTFGSGGQIWRSPVGKGATRNRTTMRDLGTWHSRRCLSLRDRVFPKCSQAGGGARCGWRTFTAVSFTASHQAPSPAPFACRRCGAAHPSRVWWCIQTRVGRPWAIDPKERCIPQRGRRGADLRCLRRCTAPVTGWTRSKPRS